MFHLQNTSRAAAARLTFALTLCALLYSSYLGGSGNEFGGNYARAEMVKAWISSGEYRQRFGHD